MSKDTKCCATARRLTRRRLLQSLSAQISKVRSSTARDFESYSSQFSVSRLFHRPTPVSGSQSLTAHKTLSRSLSLPPSTLRSQNSEVHNFTLRNRTLLSSGAHNSQFLNLCNCGASNSNAIGQTQTVESKVKKERKKISCAWDHFTRKTDHDGSEKDVSNYCKKEFFADTKEHDGTKEANVSIERVRQALRYIRQSPARWKKFQECCENENLVKKYLWFDVPIRWNSTYMMLRRVIEYESEIIEYVDRDIGLVLHLKFVDIMDKNPTARDVLAIPVSSVASECAFSNGGCILDSFRSSLTPKLVQDLVCLQEWLRSEPQPINIEEDLDFLEQLEQVNQISSCLDFMVLMLDHLFGITLKNLKKKKMDRGQSNVFIVAVLLITIRTILGLPRTASLRRHVKRCLENRNQNRQLSRIDG
ncbi:hypothetical protein KY290_000655 [Solanum tuberosum]|uniref:HAT C-terminal dimerisation domain-containing protein n=1 Tax=Solanum tuberosum TaxID=4113 RepID=A0ABQ7WJY1_SOLTU|nr:hypothetical protein KY290_000655 [Solanum tuberosum]